MISAQVLSPTGIARDDDLVGAIDWAAEQSLSTCRPSVINVSINLSKNKEIDDAVARAVDSGVHVVVSAGNAGRDAGEFSLASADGAIVVGSVDRRNKIAWDSNFGPKVDVFAPGVDITSAWFTGIDASHTLSGTSMAAAHVSGVAALYLGESGDLTPRQLKSAILDDARKGMVKGLKSPKYNGTPNRICSISKLI